MLLRDKLQVKIEPPKNLKTPDEDNNMPVSENRVSEDRRVYFFNIISAVTFILLTLLMPKSTIRSSSFVEVGKHIDQPYYIFEYTKDIPSKSIEFIDIYFIFRNTAPVVNSTFDLNMTVDKISKETIHLNGSFANNRIHDGEEMCVYHDKVVKFDKLVATINISTSSFRDGTTIEILFEHGNPTVTKIKVIYHFLFIGYLIFALLLCIKREGITTPEQTISTVLFCAAILALNPFTFLKLKGVSKAFLIADKAFNRIFGGVLIFTVQASFTLSKPWAPELLEGDVAISWIFFVITTFFDLLPFIIELFNELALGAMKSLKNFVVVTSVVVGMFGGTVGYTQYKERSKVPNVLRYRFRTLSFFSVGVSAVYIAWKVLSLLRLTSPLLDDAALAVLTSASVIIYASLFWTRRASPFNWQHTGDEKLKLN